MGENVFLLFNFWKLSMDLLQNLKVRAGFFLYKKDFPFQIHAAGPSTIVRICRGLESSFDTMHHVVSHHFLRTFDHAYWTITTLVALLSMFTLACGLKRF